MSRINSTKISILKEIYLNQEIEYVKKRLLSQTVVDGCWVGKYPSRKLTVDELLAYKSLTQSQN